LAVATSRPALPDLLAWAGQPSCRRREPRDFEWIRDDLRIKDSSPKLRYKPNHSFRNYVKTKWRSAGVEKETHDAITGHGSSKDDSRNYGEYELRLMLNSIERLPNPLAEATDDLTEAAD